MLVVFFCVMMKILQFSSGHVIVNKDMRNNNRNKNINDKNDIKSRQRLKRCRRGFQSSGHQRGMTEEVCKVKTLGAHSSVSDCNSNHTSNVAATTDKNGETTSSYISNASSQDVDFIQDNSDYQWFLDYGYRDGSSTTQHSLHHHTSVLSSLATSYACDDLSYYDDMARNLDANLAEVDMEDFRTEDIHSILTTLPAMCCGELQSEREGEMFASVSGSMMAKFDFDSSLSPHTSSQGEDSAGSTDTMSICKSELLFSPVKECPLPSTNFSVDSLDCDLLTEHDIMLTCQANKDNYTIAFEGSMTLYSEDSDYHEAGESEATTSGSNNWSSTRFAHATGGRGGGGSRPLDTSMACSDSVYTTWSKLKKRSSDIQLTRHPSGNNNTTCSDGVSMTSFQPVDATALKSQSMPNLSRQRRRCALVSVSSKLSSAMSSSMESEPRTRLAGVGGCVKLFDVQQQHHHHNSSSLHSAHSETNSSVDGASSCSGGVSRKQHNFSLVKLFMKQKSVSNEGMCYAMDQSYASECWPASNNSQSEGESDSYNQDSMRQRPHRTINNAAPATILNVARDLCGVEDPENSACGCLNDCRCELHDTQNACDNGNKTTADYGTENGNNCKTTLADDLDGATNNWIRADDTATDYSTYCFEDSLVEPRRNDDSYTHKQHELIEEEEEHGSDRSESVEQLSESVSKIEESTLDIGGNSCISDQQEEHFPNSSQMNMYKLLKPKCSSSITKNITLFNVNNNNSIEREDIQTTPGRKKQEKEQSQSTQTTRLNSFGRSTPSASGESISNCSSSEETEPTRVQNLSPSRRKACSSPATIALTRNTATQIPVHLMHRSIQTSGYADVNVLKSAPFKLLESPNGTSLVKIILPSMKACPGEGKLGDEARKPVYVFYPNYTLPDLAFLREKWKDLDIAKIFLMPQKFSPPPSHEPDKMTSQRTATNSKKMASTGKPQRPFSCNDVEALRKKGFGHIRDWDSLTFLLPREYRQVLSEVPEIVHHLKGKNEDSLRPLFCVSPPLRSCSKVSRPMSCDCASFVTTAEGKPLPACSNAATNVSSSSSTATQPSSGYRGSSTILTDSSSNHNPSNYNPLFVYRYDSVSSESSLMMNQPKSAGASQPPAPPLPKRSISLPAGREESGPVQHIESYTHPSTPPRPPLPRGILRKSLESNNNNAVHYNCKAHKNSANSKRYSMFELGGMSEVRREVEDILVQNKRRSLQDVDFSEYAESPRKTMGRSKIAEDVRRKIPSEKDVDEMEDEEFDDEGVDAGTDSSLEEGHLDYQVRPPTPPIPRTPEVEQRYCFTKAKPEEQDIDKDKIVQLEDFLHMSGLSIVCSGESLGEWNEDDMMKLRQQVSIFLSSKQNGSISSHQVNNEHGDKPGRTPNNTPEHHGVCDSSCCGKATGAKKTVSFAEKVCIHVRETGTPTDAASDRALLYTPPNSPNVSTNLGTQRAYQCKLNPPLVDMPIREEAECSPDGYASPPAEGTRVAVVPSISIAQRPIPIDLSQKRALVTAVNDAVEQIICHFSAAENQAHCSILGDSSQTPACAQLALSKLCPALYAVLSDGLQPTLHTAFGSIQNSVWQVVEASAQQGLMTKALSDLVLRLNGEDVLTEGLMKFNAFVFGLLNVRSLDAWAGYLRTRESVLRKHYAPDGLLLLANTAGAAVRALTDQLLASLQPLSLLPFKLDLLFEVRQLHHSLRRVGSLPQPDITSQQPSSSSPTSGKSWTLMKFVRSIQNSLNQSGDDENQGGWHHRRPVPTEVLPRVEEPTHHPNCTAASADSPPLPDLLDSSSCTHKPSAVEDKPRPRSCVDNTAQGASFSLVTDIASTVKRWSGIQLGSKLFQAFDRLATEDTEEEYSDSLENKPRGRRRQTSSSSNNSTSDDYGENMTRDESGSPAPLVVDKAAKMDETSSGGTEPEEKAASVTGEGKFRRLQMKWEMLSGKEASTNEKVSPGGPASPGQASDVTGGSTNTSVTNSSRSKIPRPVTSPVRASGIPVLSPQQSTRTKKTVVAPPTPTSSSQLRRPSNVSAKFKISPSGAKESSDGKDGVIKPQTGKAANVNIPPVVKRQPSAATRCSRVDQLHSEEQGHGPKGHAVRPSSLPYRPTNTVQGNKSGQAANKVEVLRRAASSSLNRQRHGGSQDGPRYVQTLCHRLPSDSGHLSFNEGERLRLILEVDEKWLLCCRGDQKGLVPRTAVNAGLVPRQAVIALQDNISRF